MLRLLPFSCALFVLASSAMADSAPSKLPPPDATAQKASLNLVNDVFKDDIANAKTPQQQTDLAKKMLQSGLDTKDDPAARYVQFMKAQSLAVQAGDAATALNAIDEMDKAYQIDALKMKVDALAAAAKNLRLKDAFANLAELSQPVIDAAIAADRYDLARPAADLALAAARRTDDLALIKRATTSASEVEACAAAFTRLKDPLATLACKPTDPDSNLAVGRFHCFIKCDWNAGLPMLALGSDPSLKALAQKEITGAADSDSQLALGDQWWAVAEKETGLAKNQIQKHAGIWYSAAAPGLSGLAKVKTESRLRTLAQGPNTGATRPHLDSRPDNILVLFDGRDTSHWQPQWSVVDGAMVSDKQNIYTREKFTDFKLHLEFNEPKLGPDFKSQNRGNSGVFLQGRYEIQILDSYENQTFAKGGCASVFGIADPLKNVPRPPGEWQTYDITFHAARFKDGNKIQNARVTLYWNGELVQDNTEIPGKTNLSAPEADTPGPIGLQYHRNSVKFRNIKIIPLAATDALRAATPQAEGP